MSAPSERILRLLSLLQQRRDWPGAELAGRLEVSPRTLRRDIDRLRMLGYPVDGDRGVDGGYRLAPGASLPPLVLDDEEAVAMVVALRLAANDASVAAETAVSALAKVVQVLPPRLRRQADDVAAAVTVATPWSSAETTLDANALVALATAARNTERVEFGYRDREGDETERCVEPVRLVVHRRRWYLVAYDVGRHDWRTFRIDRLGEVRRDRSSVRAEAGPLRRPGRVRQAVGAPTGGADRVRTRTRRAR